MQQNRRSTLKKAGSEAANNHHGGSVNWFDIQPTKTQQPQDDDELDHSPFRGHAKKSRTPHNGSAGPIIENYSPIKGRQDPNMAAYARQNAQQKQPQIAQLANMSVPELMGHKQELEEEYQRLPTTVSGKSIQVRKRKEELEFELDLVEKQIYRAR